MAGKNCDREAYSQVIFGGSQHYLIIIIIMIISIYLITRLGSNEMNLADQAAQLIMSSIGFIQLDRSMIIKQI